MLSFPGSSGMLIVSKPLAVKGAGEVCGFGRISSTCTHFQGRNHIRAPLESARPKNLHQRRLEQ